VDFSFPSGASIPANGYVLVCGNKAYLQTIYQSATIYGNWSGKLGNKGDKLRLKDQYGNLADEVNYKTGGDWPDVTTNKGSSLELISPTMDNNRASAWRASDESTKGQWTPYSITGTYQELFDHDPWHSGDLNGFANEQAREELTIQLAKDGHTILRNIQVRDGGGNNMISANVNTKSSNGSSSSGWLCQGTHAESYVDGEGLHVVADGHGDQRPNHCEIDCTGINNGGTYTIQFEARWVSGNPRLIAMRDNEGNLIYDFNYLPTAPWPTAGAGQGPSIEVVNTSVDYNLGTNWVASAVMGGTPGAGGTPPVPVDTDGVGYTDEFELKYGTDPNNATSRLLMSSRFRSSGKRAISFSSALGTTYRVEYRNELSTGASWQTLTLP